MVQGAALHPPQVQQGAHPVPLCWAGLPPPGWHPAGMQSLICSFIHLCMHSFVHAFICAFIHLVVRLFVHSFVRSFVHPSTHLPIHPSNCLCGPSIHLPVRSFVRSFTHSSVRSFVLSFTHSFFYSFIHSCICSVCSRVFVCYTDVLLCCNVACEHSCSNTGVICEACEAHFLFFSLVTRKKSQHL